MNLLLVSEVSTFGKGLRNRRCRERGPFLEEQAQRRSPEESLDRKFPILYWAGSILLPGLARLNDVRLERANDREQLLFLRGGYFECIQGIHQMVHNYVELCFCDAQTCVNGFGWSADDLARPTRDVADQIDVLLDERPPGVRTHSLEKGRGPRIGEELLSEVVHHR